METQESANKNQDNKEERIFFTFVKRFLMTILKPVYRISIFLLLTISGFSQPVNHTIDSIIHCITPPTYRMHFDSLRTNLECNRKVYDAYKQGKDHDVCRDYIFRTFKKCLGEQNVYLHQFEVNGSCGLTNVIAFKKGLSPSKGIIIVSAHYDSNNNRDQGSENPVCSPGANDNGTGVAAILEIARVVSNVKMDQSILFAAWDFEEQFTDGFAGGSNRWYTDHIIRKKYADWNKIKDGGKIKFEQLNADINFDMFGHPNDTIGGKLLLWACTGNVIHSGFVKEYVSAFKRYVPGIEVANYGKLTYSDHYTFAARRIPSVENLESGYDEDPFYHTCSDNLENTRNINFDFAVDVTRGGMAFILEKAGIVLPLIEKTIVHTIPVMIYEFPEAYCIKLPAEDVNVQIIDQFGNSYIVYKQEYFSTFYPSVSGMYKIYIHSREGRASRVIYLQKKEGHDVSFF
jgi:hypothetical protein